MVYTDISYFNTNGKKIKLKECIIYGTFIFDKQHFMVVSKGNRYYICIEIDGGDLVSFWGVEMNDLTYADVQNLFKKKYKLNNINETLIKNYMSNPLKYTLTIITNSNSRSKKIK